MLIKKSQALVCAQSRVSIRMLSYMKNARTSRGFFDQLTFFFLIETFFYNNIVLTTDHAHARHSLTRGEEGGKLEWQRCFRCTRVSVTLHVCHMGNSSHVGRRYFRVSRKITVRPLETRRPFSAPNRVVVPGANGIFPPSNNMPFMDDKTRRTVYYTRL